MEDLQAQQMKDYLAKGGEVAKAIKNEDLYRVAQIAAIIQSGTRPTTAPEAVQQAMDLILATNARLNAASKPEIVSQSVAQG